MKNLRQPLLNNGNRTLQAAILKYGSNYMRQNSFYDTRIMCQSHLVFELTNLWICCVAYSTKIAECYRSLWITINANTPYQIIFLDAFSRYLPHGNKKPYIIGHVQLHDLKPLNKALTCGIGTAMVVRTFTEQVHWQQIRLSKHCKEFQSTLSLFRPSYILGFPLLA